MNLFLSAWDNDGAISSMSAWYRANASFDLEVDNKISTPGLLVLAPDDAFSARQIGLNSLEFLEQGRLLELERGTHWVIQEKPQEIGEILVDYFSRKSNYAALAQRQARIAQDSGNRAHRSQRRPGACCAAGLTVDQPRP